MDNIEKFKISANNSIIGFIGGFVVLIILFPIFSLFAEGSSIKMTLIGILFLALKAVLIYLLIYACDAWVDGDKVVLKKMFRKEKNYSFDKIGKLKSIQIKRDKYTTVEMKNDENTTEKYIIMNKMSLFPSENDKDAEQTLIKLKNLKKES